MKRLTASEIIFKVIAYTLLCVFALMCLYPFVYSVSAALSGREAFESGQVVLLPIDIQFEAFEYVFNDKLFWVSYMNTMFVTFFGTFWSVATSVLAAYALSKRNFQLRRGINFFLVFTLWFTAGLFPQYLVYLKTREAFRLVGITDDKWLVVISMGMAAFNIILLRNSFESIPKEIEEAAIVDGANHFHLLYKVYLPMSKATIATVTLFFAISRWNGYFWAMKMIEDPNQVPLQVYIKQSLDRILGDSSVINADFAPQSVIYAMIVCAIIPIIIVYPYIQKYFAKGVNAGGVKE